MKNKNIKPIAELPYSPQQQQLLKAFHQDLLYLEHKYQAWFDAKEQAAPGRGLNKLAHYYIFEFKIPGTYFAFRAKIELPSQIMQECEAAYNKLVQGSRLLPW